MRALIGWGTTVLLFLVVLPLFYVYMRTSIGKSGIKRQADPTIFLRQHPRDIFILGILCGVPCLVVLVFLEAPPLLLCTIAALLVSGVAVALLNMFYRVSYHLTAFTVLVIMVAMTWSQILFLLFAAIPLISWAKYQLHEHSPAQMAIGVALSAAVTVTTLYFVG